MFRSARLKLTAWYLLSIMAISILFSLAVYQSSAFEIRRAAERTAIRQAFEQAQNPHTMDFAPGDPFMRRLPGSQSAFEQLYEEARMRMAYRLVGFNFGIFVLAAAAGYLLAGRTLRPIEVMVDEQKRFVADASHELRTPLTAMRTETEVALRDKEFDPTYAKEVLESNLEEIGKLQQLSDYLLTLGRFQNVSKNYNFAEISLSDVVEEAYQDVKSLAQARDIEIQSDINDVTLEADRDSLVKLLIILLDNAIKYSPLNGKIILRTQPSISKVVITVQDFGAGIRAGDLPYIFNRFYRADAARTKTNVEGYGLGLSIAKSIIDMHNGKVNVESTPNEGTTFTITLPRKQ